MAKIPVPPGGAPLAHCGASLAHGGAPIAHGGAPIAHGRAPLAPGGAPLAPGGAPLAPGGAFDWHCSLLYLTHTQVPPQCALCNIMERFGKCSKMIYIKSRVGFDNFFGIAHVCTSLKLKVTLKVQYHGKIQKMLQNDIHEVLSWI